MTINSGTMIYLTAILLVQIINCDELDHGIPYKVDHHNMVQHNIDHNKIDQKPSNWMLLTLSEGRTNRYCDYEELKKMGEKYFSRDKNKRPPYTFKRLILQALLSTPNHQMTIGDIVMFIRNKYAFYKNDTIKLNWETSLKKTLYDKQSRNIFIRCGKSNESPAMYCPSGRKGTYWSFKDEYKKLAYSQAYRVGKHWLWT